MKHYLFSYGSLINTKSRLRTADTNVAVPVRVKGLQRSWNYHNPERKRHALGVIFTEGAECNGVIVEIHEENFNKFDEREKGYKRVKLDLNNVNVLNGNILEGLIWVYIPEEPTPPTSESPMHQSYIDVVIAGCLEYGEDFAIECIKNTLYWDCAWINDRKNPGYPRTIKDLPIDKIDQILKIIIPDAFAKRIEIELKSENN